jgi:hypothetical protein
VATQNQIVNGQQFAIGSPQWYAAQQADTVRRQGVAGTAAGTGEANYLAELSPSLQGLYSAAGLNGPSVSMGAIPDTVSGGGTGVAGTVGYQAPAESAINPAQVDSSGLTSAETSQYNPTAQIAPLDLAASDNAAFATAKDQAARTAQASMTGLQQALAARGMGGAGYEAGQIGNTLATAANTIGEAGRTKAIEDANLTAQGNLANLGAQVTQRGQDIGAQQATAGRALQGKEAAYSGGITQRQQDMAAQEEQANRQAEEAGTAFQGGISQRAQDIGANEAAYSGQIAQRGQDIGAAESAASLAQQQAALKSSNTLAILRSVLGGGPPANAGAYVY